MSIHIDLDGEEAWLFIGYIRREKTMDVMADELGVEKDSVRKRIYRTKVKITGLLLDEFKEI